METDIDTIQTDSTNLKMAGVRVTTSKRLAYNTLFNVVRLITISVINFFLIRFFLGQLGESRYGVWLLIASTFRYRDILGLGLNSAVNRYIPVYLAKDDKDGIQRVINTSLVFFLLLAFVVILFTLAFYFNMASWFAIEQDLVGTAARLVLIVGLCAACEMPIQPSSAILSGLQRYDILNAAALAPFLLRSVLVIVLLLKGYGLITMGLIFGGSEIVIRSLQLFLAHRLLPNISISLKSIDLKLLREMLAYGINTFLYATAVLVIYKASDLIIGIFIGTAEVSQFAIAAAAVLLLSQFLQTFTKAIKPAVSDLDAREDHRRIREMSFLMQKYSLLLIIPAGCFLIFMGREFLSIWVGSKFQDPTVVNRMGVILAILAVAQCLRLAQHSNFLVLVGKGEHKVFGLLTALSAISFVILSVFSVKVLQLGLMGIAWSNFLPITILSGLILPMYFNHKMKISLKENIQLVWVPALLGTMPSVIVIIIWKHLAPPASWLEIMGVIATAIVLTLCGSWMLSFSKLERTRFLSVVVPGRSKTL